MECEEMIKFGGLILALVAGLFFLIGGLISLKVKNKNKLNHFSIALALVVMLGIIIGDLGPEIFELLEDITGLKKFLIIVGSVIVGIIVVKVLDLFIPDHHHEHHDNEKNVQEHESHVHHIGTLTIISLILHNILEGLAICGIASNDFKIGILMSISVALHNVPLGTHIFSSLDLRTNKLLLGSLTLSSLVGGFIFLLFGSISNLIIAIVTGITLGMLIYIAVFELLPEMWHNRNNKETIYGIIAGIIILGISLLL
ncbi:MAG: ZIP family metal transporter [Bacilli bacterium]|nr:ZIP family metal transporter [Bacilli bacterium]